VLHIYIYDISHLRVNPVQSNTKLLFVVSQISSYVDSSHLIVTMHGIKCLASGCNFYFHSATVPSWLGHPHYLGFTIPLRYTAIGRTPLDE